MFQHNPLMPNPPLPGLSWHLIDKLKTTKLNILVLNRLELNKNYQHWIRIHHNFLVKLKITVLCNVITLNDFVQRTGVISTFISISISISYLFLCLYIYVMTASISLQNCTTHKTRLIASQGWHVSIYVKEQKYNIISVYTRLWISEAAMDMPIGW